jgi:uncharacterized protein YukE
MSVTCPSNTALTDAELNQTYGNGNQPGLLPSSPPLASDREGNGLLKTSYVKTIIENLKKSGVIPTPTPTNTIAFFQKQKVLLDSIKLEYCFYYSRYTYSLGKLFGMIRQGYVTNTAESQTAVKKYLGTTQELNKKMNDLVQLINGVSEELLLSSTVMEKEIKEFDNQIKQLQVKLQEQNKIISSSEAVTKLNKEMVKYTEEKARYTDNLLKMYSVLNVVALGLLVYVYKSAGE